MIQSSLRILHSTLNVATRESGRFPVRQFGGKADREKFFLLRYNFVPSILEKRGPFRQEHLEYAQSFVDNGVMIAGGAHRGVSGMGKEEEPTGGLLLFKANDVSLVSDFANGDPYVINHLVSSWDVQEWVIAVSSKILEEQETKV